MDEEFEIEVELDWSGQETVRSLLRRIDRKLDKVLKLLQHAGSGRPASGSFFFTSHDGKVSMADFTLKDTDPAGVGAVSYVDADGAPAAAGAAPVWSVDDPTILAVTPAADGLSASIAPAQPPKLGTATVTVTLTNPDGSVVTVSAQGAVVGGEPASGTFAFTPGA